MATEGLTAACRGLARRMAVAEVFDFCSKIAAVEGEVAGRRFDTVVLFDAALNIHRSAQARNMSINVWK